MFRKRSSSDSSARRLLAVSLAVLALAACDDTDDPFELPTEEESADAVEIVYAGSVKVIRRSGDITGGIADFQAILGEPNNGATPGAQPAGRREINWDGTPPQFLNASPLPVDFFNVNSPRGVVFETEGDIFRVSDNDFSDLQATYDAQFNVFSPNKTFAPTSARRMRVTFHVPGNDDPATVSGFGAVFSDVDRSGSSAIEYYDAQGQLIARYVVPPRSDATGLSFLGVDFGSPIVASVILTVGDRRVGDLLDITDGGRFDLAVMDDFLYGEPVASNVTLR